MAASTAIVVRRKPTTEPKITATKRPRARGHRGNAVNLKQIGYGVAGAAASAAVTAGLVTWLDMRPWIAGLATGGIGAVGAVALGGPIVRPFATGVALAGGAVAMTSALIPVRQVPSKADTAQKEPQKEPAKQLQAGSAGSASAAPSQREAGAVSEQMKMQIRQAMRQR